MLEADVLRFVEISTRSSENYSIQRLTICNRMRLDVNRDKPGIIVFVKSEIHLPFDTNVLLLQLARKSKQVIADVVSL